MSIIDLLFESHGAGRPGKNSRGLIWRGFKRSLAPGKPRRGAHLERAVLERKVAATKRGRKWRAGS